MESGGWICLIVGLIAIVCALTYLAKKEFKRLDEESKEPKSSLKRIPFEESEDFLKFSDMATRVRTITSSGGEAYCLGGNITYSERPSIDGGLREILEVSSIGRMFRVIRYTGLDCRGYVIFENLGMPPEDKKLLSWNDVGEVFEKDFEHRGLCEKIRALEEEHNLKSRDIGEHWFDLGFGLFIDRKSVV